MLVGGCAIRKSRPVPVTSLYLRERLAFGDEGCGAGRTGRAIKAPTCEVREASARKMIGLSGRRAEAAARRANHFGFTEMVSSPGIKNISVYPKPKSGVGSARLTRTQGASAVVTYVAVRCGGRGSHEDERGCRVRRSRVVRRPNAGVKLAESIPSAVVAIEHVSPGRPRYKP
jgi:hypothetical protein